VRFYFYFYLEWDKLAFFLPGELDLLGNGPDVGGSTPEDDVDLLGAAPERRGGAVEGGVAGAEHHHGAVQTRQGRLAGAHSSLAALGHLRQEPLGREEALRLAQSGKHAELLRVGQTDTHENSCVTI